MTGAERDVVVPSPTCPSALLPQHARVPSPRMTQAWASPTAIAPTPVWKPATPDGVGVKVGRCVGVIVGATDATA